MRIDKYYKYAFLSPVIFYILIFTIFPLIFSLSLCFFHWDMLASITRFVGLRNFKDIFHDYRFWNALRVTFIFVGTAVSLEFVIGLGLALTLYKGIRGQKFIRTLITAPIFIAPIAVSLLFVGIFYERGGMVNTVLGIIGLPSIPWLSNANIAIFSIILVDVWQWTPFMFLLLLAGLQSLPIEPFESAVVDGASKIQIFSYITLPMLRPIIITVIVLRLTEACKIFDLPMGLTHGGPGISTESYSMYTYIQGIQNMNFGYSAALSYIFFVIVLLFILPFLFRWREEVW